MLFATALFATLLAASPPQAPAEMVIGPADRERCAIELFIPLPRSSAEVSAFRGNLLLFRSTVPARLKSPPVRLSDGRYRVEGMIEYSKIDPAFPHRVHPDWMDYRLTGSVLAPSGSRRVDWRGRIERPHIRLKEPLADMLRRFVEVDGIGLPRVGLRQSGIDVRVSVKQPLPFDLNFFGLTYALEIHDQKVGIGARETLSLRRNQSNSVHFPLRINHSAVLSALRNVVTKRGAVNGELLGTGKLRLPSGEENFSFRLPVKVSLL